MLLILSRLEGMMSSSNTKDKVKPIHGAGSVCHVLLLVRIETLACDPRWKFLQDWVDFNRTIAESKPVGSRAKSKQ